MHAAGLRRYGRLGRKFFWARPGPRPNCDILDAAARTFADGKIKELGFPFVVQNALLEPLLLKFDVMCLLTVQIFLEGLNSMLPVRKAIRAILNQKSPLNLQFNSCGMGRRPRIELLSRFPDESYRAVGDSFDADESQLQGERPVALYNALGRLGDMKYQSCRMMDGDG